METPLEQALMTCGKNKMIAFLTSNPQYFDEAVTLAASDKQPYAWRSAFLLWSCIKDNDPKIKKHIGKLVNSISGKNDGHQRELIKILSKMKLSERQESILYNLCYELLKDINKKPSIRFTALKFMLKTAEKYEGLANEIHFVLQDRYLKTLSPGVKNSIHRMIAESKIKPSL